MTSQWILTYTGKKFWPLDPQPQDIDIVDIAHALSLMCRFTGHVKEFYSVAQHCVLASRIVPKRHAKAALLHDASEAYLCDLSRPVKCSDAMAGYREVNDRLESIIDNFFGIDSHVPEVKEADLRLLFTERRDLMHPHHWELDRMQLEMCLPKVISGWTSQRAEREFLKRYGQLI